MPDSDPVTELLRALERARAELVAVDKMAQDAAGRRRRIIQRIDACLTKHRK